VKKVRKERIEGPPPHQKERNQAVPRDPSLEPYVVGIGASAGGLEAFEQFFAHLPPTTRMAFVLVQHLELTHKGMMPELLARHTKMQVVQVQDGMQVQPNCVYVIPPNADLAIATGPAQSGRERLVVYRARRSGNQSSHHRGIRDWGLGIGDWKKTTNGNLGFAASNP
jgi:chemotaxis response regulator CheB